MATITKASSEDFERVYPLFECFGDTALSKQEWRKIFEPPWKTVEDFCGYMLIDDGAVKGYLGAIFSRRLLSGRAEKLCNMTSWIVKEEYRGKSILLLLELMKLKDYSLTNFTASPTVAAILSKLGFNEFPVDQRVLFPIPKYFHKQDASCEFDLEKIKSKLAGEEITIFEDHQQLNCQHVLLQSAAGNCYVVLKKTKRKHLTFAKVQFLSDPEVFNKYVTKLAAAICLQLRVVGVMVDERYIKGHPLPGSVRYPHQRKAYFKSASIADPDVIDTLYSEMVILHS